MTHNILILLFLFQIKHLIADYYLQFPYMYENKGKDKGWVGPLIDHSLVHAVSTLIIVSIYFILTNVPSEVGSTYAMIATSLIFLFDAVTHFLIDRWKAIKKTNPSESRFWRLLGIDQFLHHIVGIIIIYSIAKIGG